MENENWFNKKYLGLIVILLVPIIFSFSQSRQESPIVGTWISQNDQKQKWVFTSDSTTTWCYNNEKIDEYTFEISDTSPQCGKEVETGKNLMFLSLTNKNNGSQQCYFINTLNDSSLSLSPFGRSNIMYFEKQ